MALWLWEARAASAGQLLSPDWTDLLVSRSGDHSDARAVC